MQPNGPPRGGNRYNPISRGGGQKVGGGYNNNVPPHRGGAGAVGGAASWGTGFTRGGGRGGFGDDSVAWN